MLQGKAVVLILGAVAFSALGQLCLKSGARHLAGLGQFEFLLAVARNVRILSGLAAWAASTLCWLYVLRAAWMMDLRGNKSARVDVSAIKVVVSRMQTRVLDRAIQVFGAKGLTNDTPLAFLWTWGRALRFIDGPDEVHNRVVARAELRKHKGR